MRLWRRLVPFESALLGHRLPQPLQLVEHAAWRRDGLDRFCWRCGVTRVPFECLDGGCAECRGRQLGVTSVVRLGAYAPPLTQWVPAVKSRAWRSMGVMLGRELGAQALEAILAGRMPQPSLVVPIPSHPLRTLTRGIAHTEVIAAEVARALGCPMARVLGIPLVLRQARASRGVRRRNTRRFRVVSSKRQAGFQDVWWHAGFLRGLFGGINLPSIRGLSVLVVDDVRTTGGTIEDAARALRAAGALRVDCAVCAVADPPRRNALRGR